MYVSSLGVFYFIPGVSLVAVSILNNLVVETNDTKYWTLVLVQIHNNRPNDPLITCQGTNLYGSFVTVFT